MTPLTLIFVGPQGSGKGTQIEKIKTTLENKTLEIKITDIQTGRLFRGLMSGEKTFATEKILSSIQEGVLQPDFLTYTLWGQQMLNELTPEHHLLIDGFPRNLEQAKVLAGALTFFERKKIQVINLDTPEEIVRSRMKGRGRADDTEESINKRLLWYKEETLPVLEYYREQENSEVFDIDGRKTIEEVHEQIIKELGI